MKKIKVNYWRNRQGQLENIIFSKCYCGCERKAQWKIEAILKQEKQMLRLAKQLKEKEVR